MAYYDFKKKPALTTKEGEKDVLYPSIVFNGTINTKQLLKQLVARTGYKPGVVEGTLMELVDLVGEYIGQGYRVEVQYVIDRFSFQREWRITDSNR